MSKTILITGASTGFGRRTAESLAREGHSVFASMRESNGKNRDHATDLTAQGMHVVDLDVTSTSSVETAVAEVERRAGRLDVLINNAGIASAGITETFTDDQVASVFEVNVVGVHRVTRAVLPKMRENNDGLIINIGSILGRVTFPFFGIYGASKFAIEAMTDSLRYEVSQLGIDVALVQPSAYPTQMYASATRPADDLRVEKYGELANIPNAMFAKFSELFQQADSPNPQDVADAIAGLINLPKGERPARTVVGTSFGTDQANDAIAPIQNNVVEQLGLAHLASVVAPV